ncbi:MAG: ATP-binding protein, partial [Pseudomonadota bacterium]
MRIERIQLKNYRQFRDLEILFKKRSGKDLNIVVANNGTGKTNLLNAINWCLYGTEPHLSKESQQLPRLNLNTLVTANDGSDETVSVELVTETEGNRITFSRSERFSIHAKQPTLKSLSFHVTYLDEKMNAKMVTDEDAASYVARFVPQDLREFFFFDGERLDTYFKSATGAQISHAVFEISNVHTLDRMADRIETIVSDIKKEAGRSNPQLEA